MQWYVQFHDRTIAISESDIRTARRQETIRLLLYLLGLGFMLSSLVVLLLFATDAPMERRIAAIAIVVACGLVSIIMHNVFRRIFPDVYVTAALFKEPHYHYHSLRLGAMSASVATIVVALLVSAISG